MQHEIIITLNDYDRLMSLVERGTFKLKTPDIVAGLSKRLSDARKIQQQTIARGVVTMNSKVLLREITSGRENEITITYPNNAEPRERRVSVLSAIGLALLGRKEREVVSWSIPSGTGMFEIVKVTYQPEAAGDYNL
jgi:regulator of nucleoside diphosphate kinase